MAGIGKKGIKVYGNKAFRVRLKPHEWDKVSKLRAYWQLGSDSAVMHRLIKLADKIIAKYEEMKAEKEDLEKAFKI